MIRNPHLCFIVTLGLAAALGAAAHAQVRFPTTGDPAFIFQAPDGWATVIDAPGSIAIVREDRCCAVKLSIITDAAAETTPASEIADQVIKANGGQPYTKSEPAKIGGLPGEAFTTNTPAQHGPPLNLRVIVIKLDSFDYATVSIVNKPDISPAMSAALDDLVAQVKFTGISQ